MTMRTIMIINEININIQNIIIKTECYKENKKHLHKNKPIIKKFKKQFKKRAGDLVWK